MMPIDKSNGKSFLGMLMRLAGWRRQFDRRRRREASPSGPHIGWDSTPFSGARACARIAGMEEPRVSIVLRSYNEAWALRSTLDALKTQSHRNWELIVFDSGSVDGSVEIIRAAKPAHF